MSRKRGPHKIALVMLVSGLVMAGATMYLVKREVREKPAGESKILGLMAREARGCIASLLWLKVDSYAHFDVHPGEYLPLVRVVASLDPNFIDAYTLGAYWLCEKMDDRLDQGIAFLEEGLRNNVERPGVDQIHFELGWQLYFQVGDYERATHEFYAALRTITREDSASIYLLKNYLRLFAWSSLMAGYHKTFHETVMIFDYLYPDSTMESLPIVQKLLSNYFEEEGCANLQVDGISTFFRENAYPAREVSDYSHRFELNFVRELPSSVEQARPESQEPVHHHLDRRLTHSITDLHREHHNHGAANGGDVSVEEGHHHCHHDHVDIWNEQGTWPAVREGFLALILGLVCFCLKRKM